MPQIEMVKKLSVKKVIGAKPKFDDEDQKTKDVMQVVGVASGMKTGTSDNGDWTALTGNFAAVNLETGEQFRSGVCFIPDVALDPIVGQLNQGVTAVEFGWTISIKRDENAATGYVYTARPLIEADENDPLEQLVSHLDTAPALEDKSEDKATGKTTRSRATSK